MRLGSSKDSPRRCWMSFRVNCDGYSLCITSPETYSFFLLSLHAPVNSVYASLQNCEGNATPMLDVYTRRTVRTSKNLHTFLRLAKNPPTRSSERQKQRQSLSQVLSVARYISTRSNTFGPASERIRPAGLSSMKPLF
jgi:hypothetical protein